jgi:hypothetical protein
MKRLFTFFLLFLASLNFAQIGLPIQHSLLPKNSLVVNYDFSKVASFTRGATTVTNIAGTASGNATIVNSPVFMNSLGFVSLNGTNQYVVTPNLRTYFKTVNTSAQKSFTMSFWVYPTATSGNLVYELDSQTPDFAWNASNIEIVNGFIKYRIWNGSIITSTTSVNMNQWYHVAMVYDGASVKGYLNGVLQGTQTGVRTIPINGQFYAIGAGGRQNMGTAAYGKFNLAQYKLHNLPLTDKDIAVEYESRKEEFDYSIHSPSTNSNPTYWNRSSVWDNSNGTNGPGDAFSVFHYTPWLNSELGWAAGANNANQWITLNYDEPTFIKGVVVQGRLGGWQLVTKAHVETSLTGSAPWSRILNNVTVNTTTNPLNDVRLDFPSTTFAKAIRFIPTEWSGHITLRLGMLVKPNNYTNDGLVLRLDAANTKSYPGTGNIWTDVSGNNNNGSLTDGPTFNAGSGGQIIFDGVNDFVTGTTISSTSGNNSRTVIAWYKSTSNQNTSILDKGDFGTINTAEQLFIVAQNGVGDLNVGSTLPPTNIGGICIAFWGNDIYYPIPAATMFDGNWHCVAYTYDSSNTSVKIFFDGVFASTIYLWNGSWNTLNSSPYRLQSAISTTNNPYWIGRARAKMWGKGNEYANANIGGVNIYNRPLSEQEIIDYYNNTRYRYNVVEFKTVGTTTWKVPSGVTSVDYLVVGGGGGGANGYDNAGGGGGGAGMVLSGSMPVLPGNILNITIGDGGAGGANTRLNNAGSTGDTSSFHTINALGGGGGFGSRTTAPAGAAQIGSNSAPVGGGGSQGGNGGKGGGGSTGIGSSNSGTIGGAGGTGFASDISGSSLVYGTGGAGANSGTQNGGANGANNTGNGGMAGGAAPGSSVGGGKGGSGVVILKLNFN